MSSSNSRKNTLIGAFVLGAIALALVAASVVIGGSWGKESFKVVMAFDGSVNGLTIGAPVAFRGVEIGQVTNIELIFQNESADIITQVKADIHSDNISRMGIAENDLISEMIDRGLRAQLNTISLLTGLLYVQLDFEPDSAAKLADIDVNAVQIPTVPTDFERLTREIEQVDFIRIASQLQGTLEGLNTLVNNPDIQQLGTEIKNTLASVQTLVAQLDQQLGTIGPDLNQVINRADATVAAVNAQVPVLSNAAQAALGEVENAVSDVRETLDAFKYTFSDDSPTLYEFNQAVTEVAKAGRAIQRLADTLEQQPEALLRGKQQENN